jgi:CRISPR-associated protein Cmr6
MNLRHYYYTEFFKGIDLRQPLRDADRSLLEEGLDKRNPNGNESKFWRHCLELCKKNVPLTLIDVPSSHSITLELKKEGLLIGKGFPHEIGYAGEAKLGFQFDFTTGLPAIPGSSVKGAIRSGFPQFEFDKDKNQHIWKPDATSYLADKQIHKCNIILDLLVKELKDTALYHTLLHMQADASLTQSFVHQLELLVFEGIVIKEAQKPQRLRMLHHTVFFDALPTRLSKAGNLMGWDSITPHNKSKLKSPNPIQFIKVVPGVHFTFHFRLSKEHLEIYGVSIPPHAILALFTHLLIQERIGAKKRHGYGVFKPS